MKLSFITFLMMSSLSFSALSSEVVKESRLHTIEKEKIEKREDILEAKIFYTFARIGKADIYFNTTEDGKILDLNVEAKLGIGNANFNISEKVRLDQLKSGQELAFSIEGSADPILKLSVDPDFDENGGWATLKVKSGNDLEYSEENIAIQKVGDHFLAYKDGISPELEISGLSIKMKTTLIPSKMGVKSYKIKLKK